MCVAVIRANDSIGRADICFVFDNEGRVKKVRKSASSADGITMLKNEIKGFQWYEKILGDAFFGVTVIREAPNYFSFEYLAFSGHQIKAKLGFSKNLPYIYRVLDHYRYYWPMCNRMVHGDLSIENVIFDQCKVRLIDWENSSFSSELNGLDPLNLIFEQLFFHIKFNDIRKFDFSTLVKVLIWCEANRLIPKKLLDNPLSSTQLLVKKNASSWFGHVSRLPILKFSKTETEYIDERILAHL
jgi:hypothetical protein